MRDSIRQRVQALGLTLPTPSQPIANGDKGRHVRTAVGVSSLPGGVAVEVDAMFELQP
ncbi:hypothetical protein HX835_07010 [Pseudomonas veronii]|nr:hypothetical protein [Pseudomonas veronii]NWC56813.1 hypothetical protein [Pseudomonas veronii]